jgi:glycosyltransferase involved in cell wall biosynthesis
MQRILYCTDSLMAGGTEQQLVELVTRLDRQRFELYVVCLYGKRGKRSLHFLDSLTSHNIPVMVFDLDWSPVAKLIGIVRLIHEIWKVRPHIVQAVNYHSNLLLRLARPFLPPLSLIGCIYVEYTLKQLRYERLSNWLCAAVVCNSLQLEKQLLRSAPHPYVTVIPNGVDARRFSADPQTLLATSVTAQMGRVLLMVGRIAKQKAPHLLIEALGVLRERGNPLSGVRLLLVGEREDDKTQALIDSAVARYRMEDCVFQYPPTLSPEIYYHSADVVVLPSLWEGLPGIVLEALAVGRPVIVSEAANAAGIIVDRVNGWVFRTDDVEHLSEVLSYVLALPSSTLKSMCRDCQESAAPYDSRLMVDNYVRLYELLSMRS